MPGRGRGLVLARRPAELLPAPVRSAAEARPEAEPGRGLSQPVPTWAQSSVSVEPPCGLSSS